MAKAITSRLMMYPSTDHPLPMRSGRVIYAATQAANGKTVSMDNVGWIWTRPPSAMSRPRLRDALSVSLSPLLRDPPGPRRPKDFERFIYDTSAPDRCHQSEQLLFRSAGRAAAFGHRAIAVRHRAASVGHDAVAVGGGVTPLGR